MPRQANQQALARRKISQKLIALCEKYDISMADVTKATGIAAKTLRKLDVFTPHTKTLARLAEYIEGVAKERAAAVRHKKKPKPKPKPK